MIVAPDDGSPDDWSLLQPPAPVRIREFQVKRRALKGDSTVIHARQAYELLRDDIVSGHLPVGYKFDETQLMDQLPATRAAVRGALSMLADEGVVRRKPAAGTVVVNSMISVPVDQYPGSTNGPVLRKVAYREISYREVSSPEIVRRGLEIDDTEVICSERIILMDGEPLELRVCYFPVWDNPLQKYRPVHLYKELPGFEERFAAGFGSEFGRSHVTISLVIGDPRTCRLLRVPPSTPLLLRTMRLLDSTDRVREVSFCYYRGDRIVFVA